MQMTSKQIIDSVTTELGITKAEMARSYGWCPQALSNRLNGGSNTLRADDLLGLLEAVGADLSISLKENKSEVKIVNPGYGCRVQGVSDGIKFDTMYSDAVSNTFYADGVNEYGPDGTAFELYIDKEGRYFVAEYHNDNSIRNRVRTVHESMAQAFIDKYGTDIFKKEN